MTMLVSLEQASMHLRRDTSADDSDLILKIKGASASIMRYIGSGADSFTDSNGVVFEDSNGIALDVPDDIQSACLLLVGDLYTNRIPTAGDVVDAQFGYGYLPRAVTALLYSYRTPVIG